MKEIDLKREKFFKIVEKTGLSSAYIADCTKQDRGNVNKYYNNTLPPSKGFLQKFEEFLGIDLLTIDDFGIDNIEINYKNDINYNSKNVITKNQHRGVPYYENMDVTATIATSFSDYPEAPTFYIDYEHFNDCTAYVPVVGDSMYPSYCSGEIIAVKSIFNLDIIQWGEAYFVVTNGNANDMRTIKQLHFHEDPEKIILRSSNPNFKGDTIISKKDILFLYIVKGKIRRNQL